MTSRLIHPRMTAVLTRDFFDQLCTLKRPLKTQDGVGEEIIEQSIHPGYEAIPCRVGPAGGGERRGNNYTLLDATHRIVLVGQYQVTEEWVAEVNGQEYEILLVAVDAEQAMTRLDTRIAR